MAHTIFKFSPSYFKTESGNLKSLGLLQYATSGYIFNPDTISGFGNKDSTLSSNQLGQMYSVLNPPDFTIPNASNFLLSNWNTLGWGSSLEDVEENYENFIANNFSGSEIRGDLAIQSLVISGTVDGQEYFVPVLLFGDQGSTPSFAKIENSGISYTSKSFGKAGEDIKVQQSQGGQGTLRYDEYNSTTIASFLASHPSAETQFRPSWTALVGNTTGFRMMFRVDTASGIAFNTIIGEQGYDDASQSSVPGFIAGVTHSFSGYYNNDFAQLGFQANSTNEIGMGAKLDGKSGELISSIKVTFENYNQKYSAWSSDGRSFISPQGFTIPVTIRVYELSSSGAEVGRLLGELTDSKLMQWVPEANAGGIAFNVSFNLTPASIKVPASEMVVVTVSFNTETKGYNPVGSAGPYNSLGVGMMEKIYDSGAGNVTYGTSAGSLVSDNGLYWCNTLPVGSSIGYIDQCKNKSLTVIRTGRSRRDFRVILGTDSTGAITSTNSQVASALNAAAPSIISVTGDASVSTTASSSGAVYYVREPVFQNNASVFADGRQGVADPSSRSGWYFANSTAGHKINWYFYDGIKFANLRLSEFSAFAVVTYDTTKTLLGFFAVYTVPTGSGDARPGFAHSAIVYSAQTPQPVIGTKYLVYFGQNPPIYPNLPRIQLAKNNAASFGDQGANERVLTVAYMTDSGAGVNTVRLVAERLGVYSDTYKQDTELKIR